MAEGATYLGPSDSFVFEDTVYRIGDKIPMTQEEMAHHAMFGHRFDEDGMDKAAESFDSTAAFEVAFGNPHSTVGILPASEPQPYDDRGEVLGEVRRVKRQQRLSRDKSARATRTVDVPDPDAKADGDKSAS